MAVDEADRPELVHSDADDREPDAVVFLGKNVGEIQTWRKLMVLRIQKKPKGRRDLKTRPGWMKRSGAFRISLRPEGIPRGTVGKYALPST